MKPLGNSFRKNGFHYELVKRDGDVAMFKQRLREGVGCLAYEVIIVQKNDDYEMAGNLIPAHESAPGNEAFGRLGWSFPSLERANVKFRQIVGRQMAVQNEETND